MVLPGGQRGNCKFMVNTGIVCPCNHYENDVEQQRSEMCAWGHHGCYHELSSSPAQQTPQVSNSFSNEIGQIFPAVGGIRGAPFIPRSITRGRSSARGSFGGRSVRGLSWNPSPTQSISSIVSTVTGNSTPGSSSTRIASESRQRATDEGTEDEGKTFKQFELFVLANRFGNSIPAANSAVYAEMRDRGMVKTLRVDTDGDTEDFQRTIENNFIFLRNERWKVLCTLGNRSSTLVDAADESSWDIKKIREVIGMRYVRIFLAPKTRELEATPIQRQRLSDVDYAEIVVREGGNSLPTTDEVATPTRPAPVLSRSVQGTRGLPAHVFPTPAYGFTASGPTISPTQRTNPPSAISNRWPLTSLTVPSTTANSQSVNHSTPAGNDSLSGQPNSRTGSAKRNVSEVDSDNEDNEIQMVSLAPATLQWPAGFDPDTVDLGMTEGAPFTASEQADPLILTTLRRFAPRVDSYRSPQWVLDGDGTLCQKYRRLLRSAATEVLLQGASVVYNEGHGVGVWKSSSTTFWDEVFEEVDSLEEGLWMTCEKGLFVPTDRTTVETMQYFREIGKMLIFCLLNGGSLPCKLHPALFERFLGPFRFNHNIIRQLNPSLGRILSYVIAIWPENLPVDVEQLPDFLFYCNQRDLKIGGFRNLLPRRFVTLLVEAEMFEVRLANLNALFYMDGLGLSDFIRQNLLWRKLYPMFYNIISTKEDLLASWLQPDYYSLPEPDLRIAMWFKNYVDNASKEEIQNIAKFVTGTLRLPIDPYITVTFDSYSSRTLQSPEGRLPRAGLCNNMLNLCINYQDGEQMVFMEDLRRGFAFNTMFGEY